MKTVYKILIVIAVAIAFWFFLNAPEKEAGGFTNVIKESGLPTHKSYGGVAWGDYNNDGFLDLLIKDGSRGYKLFENNGGADTFTDVTTKTLLPEVVNASNATFGDYNNDGCLDIYITRGLFGDDSGDTDMLFKNNCNETFSNVSAEVGISEVNHSTGVAWADYDNDGDLDIYVSTYGFLYFEKSDSGWLMESAKIEPNVLYQNNGNTFTNVSGKLGVEGIANCDGLENEPLRTKANWQPVWFDYNNDGWLDLYVSNEASVNVLYKNEGGVFTDVTKESGLCFAHSTHGVAIGDYNNDGFFDIYAAGTRRNVLWQNNGNSTFSEVAESVGVGNSDLLGWGAFFFDYDNDGDLDAYSLNGSSENTSIKNDYPSSPDKLYRNDDGLFTEVSESFGVLGSDRKTFGALGDYNNDGFVDLIAIADPTSVNSPEAINRLYRNNPNGNNWLTLKLTGTKSNKSAIGARVLLEAGSKKMWRQIVSGASLMSQNSLWQTFGLEKEKNTDKITIYWPSGIIQILNNIGAGQIIKITEPAQ